MDNLTDTELAAAYAERELKGNCIWWFEGFFVPILGSIGILGNVLSILVLTKRDLDLKSSFANLICTLCLFDILFIVTVILFYSLPIHFEFYEEEIIPYFTPALLPLIHIALTGSVYAVVAVAAERYFIICNPFNSSNQGRDSPIVLQFFYLFSIFFLNRF
jgi:hypothetical protein